MLIYPLPFFMRHETHDRKYKTHDRASLRWMIHTDARISPTIMNMNYALYKTHDRDYETHDRASLRWMPHTDACSPQLRIMHYTLRIAFISSFILKIPSVFSSLLMKSKGEFSIGEKFGDVDANPSVYCIKKEMRFKTTSL